MGFDQAVRGMHLNETKTVTIPANAAYGEANPALIVQAPADALGNETATVGMGVTRVVNGQQQQGVVTAVNSTTITVDFNSPLAGKTLIFTITIDSINKG